MKITENFTITLTCLFCDATLTKKDNEEFNSDDLIKCQNCGEENDYESVFEIAKEQALKAEAAQADQPIGLSPR